MLAQFQSIKNNASHIPMCMIKQQQNKADRKKSIAAQQTQVPLIENSQKRQRKKLN